MSSKRVTTLERDLAGSAAERSLQSRMNGDEDNDKDDGGYRGVIIVHGGLRAMWMRKTEMREGVCAAGGLCHLMCRLIEVCKVLS